VVTKQPTTIANITTTQVGVCPNRVYTYSISALPTYATSVIWTKPELGTIVSQTALSITVSYPSSTISGAVTVKGVNNCSMGTVKSLTIRLNPCPTFFTGGGGTTIRNAETNEAAQFSTAIKADVYPNPTTSSFHVRLNSNSASMARLRIFDMQGRALIQKNIKANEMDQIGQELKAGSYLLEIIQDNQRINQKLIKF
jgi:hypothetical protein